NQKLSSEVTSREATLAQLETQRQQLEATLTSTRQAAAQLDEQLAARARQAAQTQEQLAQTQARLEEVSRNRESLAVSVETTDAERRKLAEELERQRQQAAAQVEARIEVERHLANLNSAVKIAEAEKNLLRENVTELKGQVRTVQEEKARLQEQTTSLAQGFSRLAKTSEAIQQEIRENTPINANQLFAGFLTNQVRVTLSGVGVGFLGSTDREKDATALVISDGATTAALLHVNETPFGFTIPGFGLGDFSARVSREGLVLPSGRPFLSSADPRIVAVPVDAAQAKSQGVQTYPLAKDPFKFPEAVLFSRGGRRYGEVEFKLDPKTPEFVRMKNRLLSGVFGEFSPSAGDLVLSKTGELLGVMVNSDYCAVLKSLEPAPGGVFEEGLSREAMGKRLEAIRTQLNRLPSGLQ
ncbi:MAG: hypothetical protein KIT22_08840, partial [Verrucomicrobiae bacterium]|nr:hypothetical protein [Verrucomicrobiae bacterium]